MSKTNHTPGPWNKLSPGPNLAAWRIVSNDDCNVAFVSQRLSDCAADANARLIAAAPDLLAALEDQEMQATQAILAADIGKESQRKRVEFLLSQLKQMRDAARTAINKATQPA